MRSRGPACAPLIAAASSQSQSRLSPGSRAWLNPCGTALLPQHSSATQIHQGWVSWASPSGPGQALKIFIWLLNIARAVFPPVSMLSPVHAQLSLLLLAAWVWPWGLPCCHLSRQMQIFADKSRQQLPLCPCCCSTPSSERNNLNSSPGCTSCSCTECSTAQKSDELAQPGAATAFKPSFAIRAAPLLICLLLTLSVAHEFT